MSSSSEKRPETAATIGETDGPASMKSDGRQKAPWKPPTVEAFAVEDAELNNVSASNDGYASRSN